MAGTTKPFVLVCASPILGHLMPVRAIAKNLVAQGFEVTFITASAHRKIIEDVGATFSPLIGDADHTEADWDTRFAGRNSIPAGPQQIAWDMEEIFVKSVPGQFESIQRVLEGYKSKDPSRPVVLVNEMAFLGTSLLSMDTKGLKPTAILGVGIVPLTLSSIDLPPFGPGLPPDSSPEGRERNKAMREGVEKQLFAKPQALFLKYARDFGGNPPPLFFLDAPIILADRYLQMCVPGVEYPRSDLPSNVRFAGGLPRGHRDKWTEQPSWWDEVSINSQKKCIIGVSQGALALTYSDLIIPTLKAFENNPDILVVVALGKKGASLPASDIPDNARVMDYIPFDDLLQYTDVFVTNGGYGGFQHSLGHGVPLVMAGITEDKPEVSARGEWAGVAVNLRTGQPTPEAIKEGVEKILQDPKYKVRAKEIEEEMKNADPFGVIYDSINELAAKSTA